MELLIQKSVNQVTEYGVCLNSILKIKENTAWIIIGAITILAAAFIFFGPETNSEIEDAPTILSKTFDVLSVFLVSSSVLLPLGNIEKPKLFNFSIALLGAVLNLYKLIVGFYIVSVVNKSLLGSTFAACVSLFFGLIYYKKYKSFTA